MKIYIVGQQKKTNLKADYMTLTEIKSVQFTIYVKIKHISVHILMLQAFRVYRFLLYVRQSQNRGAGGKEGGNSNPDVFH